MQRPRPTRTLLLAAAGVLIGAVAQGEGMKIQPGEWQFSSVTTPPVMGPPRTEKRCIEHGEVEPGDFTQGLQNCEVSEPAVDAKTMSWKLTCSNPHGQMKGSARFSSTGDRVQGTIEMNMTMGAHTMTVKVDSKGKRLGDCS